MLTIELTGGLGNQLFQLFTILSYSIDHQDPDIFIPKDKKNNFGLSNRYLRPTYWNTIFKYIDNVILHEHQPEPINTVYRQPDFNYHPIDKINGQHIKFYGYFQSEKYFIHNKAKLMELLGYEELTKSLLEQYYDSSERDIQDFDNSVSLHFRIGDYKLNTGQHNILPLDYYDSALELLRDQNIETVYYFYEHEDKTQVTKHIDYLKTVHKYKFIEIHVQNDWEEMLIMGKCTHNIIANSSFSWWGAWLGEGTGKILYPEQWFGPLYNHDISDLCPDRWIKVKHRKMIIRQHPFFLRKKKK